MFILNESLKRCVEEIRLTKYTTLDNINNALIQELHSLEGVTYYEDVKRDIIVFALPLSTLTTKILYTDNYSLTDLVNESKRESHIIDSRVFQKIVDQLTKTEYSFESSKINTWFENSRSKPRTRTTLRFNTGDKISLNVVKNHYICSHYNPADLSMLSDFNEFKSGLNIVNKSFVTLGKPLVVSNVNVYVRDTFLLAPQKARSLDALSRMYESELGFSKMEIPLNYLKMMSLFIKEDKASFEEYAVRDAVITLKHSIEMEWFNLSLKQLGVPTTLSSLGKKFVTGKWDEEFEKYLPYQISGECLMGNSEDVQTPKGLFATGDVGLHLSYYISNYKGGRNESFMYGVDNKREWFDYDLTSAYTTAMSCLSLPAYNGGRLIDPEDVKGWNDDELLKGYLILNGTFKFPDCTKYPSIPCYMDKTTTVYPLLGKCLLTGPEYVLARNQMCEFEFKSAFYIPPTVKEKVIGSGFRNIKIPVQPFHDVIQELQRKRREFGKSHMMNALYKDLANSIYGNVVRGISNKKTFDIKSGLMLRVPGTELSNPVLAS